MTNEKPKNKKKRRGKLPVTRAFELLKARGWQPAVVERRITRLLNVDLFGFADLLAVHPESGRTLALQVTCAAGGNFAERVRKCAESAEARNCLLVGWHIEVWGFRRAPDRNGSTLRAAAVLIDFDSREVRTVDGSLIVEDF